MKDEIKEILDELKNEDNYIEDYGFRYKRIALDDVWHLLDYITNLQREVRANNDLIPYFKNKEKELKKKITNLQEENNKLKNLEYKFFDCSGDEESFTLEDYLQLGNKLYDLQEENERLKDIRNQAINYNKALCKIYDCGIELSNAETNLCILKDDETINILQEKSDE